MKIEMLAQTNPVSTIAAIIGIGLLACAFYTWLFGNGHVHHRDTEK